VYHPQVSRARWTPRRAVSGRQWKLSGTAALHLAAGRGRMKVCTYLVEELHVDVNAADESGCLFVRLLV
jgi:hypothetical protein